MADARAVVLGGFRWRSFRTAAWLGWQIESNWTDPFLFAVYSIAKPLAISAILVAMYAAVTDGNFDGPQFSEMYVGSTFYLYVGALMTGMAYAVIDDRERYRMLRAVYVAPIDVRWYLIGRGAARFLTATLAVVVNLTIGVTLLHVRISPSAVDWPLFAAAFVLGGVMLALLGLILAGITLLLGHMAWSIGDGVAGTLYLFSSAIFPLEVLPSWLQPIGYGLPLAYWLELVRRALIDLPSAGATGLSQLSTPVVLGILAAQIVVLLPISLVVFNRADRGAREKGLIDRTSNY